MTLVVRQCAELVGAGGAGLHQNVGSLTGREQQGLQFLHAPELDTVVGDDIQIVLLEFEEEIVLILRADQPPALHFAGTHRDRGPSLSVDREEARRGLRKQRGEILDHPEGVIDDLGHEHDAFLGIGDLGHTGEITLDDEGARHAARDLHVGTAVMVRVIPVSAAGVVLRQRDLDVVLLAGYHRAHDIVGDAARAAVRAVEMEVRVVELVWQRHVLRQRIAVRWKVVRQPDLQRLARLHAQRRTVARAFVAAEVEPLPADVLVSVSAGKCRIEHAIG